MSKHLPPLILCALLVVVSAPARAETAPDHKPDRPERPDAPEDGPRAALKGHLMQMLGGDGSAAARSILIESPSDLSKVNNLPLGPQRRFVLSVPVGGLDNLNSAGNGWKMEQIFTLTDEQQKSVVALRDEYQAEKAKLEADIAVQQKALAEKAKALRDTFEQRANDILTGADKDAKEKIDAMARDTQAKNAAAATDLATLAQDPNNKDPRQIMMMARTVRETTSRTAQEARKTLLAILPAESRARAEDLIKLEEANKPWWDNADNWGGGGGGGGGGAGKHHGNKGPGADTKPAEPQKEQKDF